MKKEIYGFLVDKYPIDIKETTERKALIKLVNNYWQRIQATGGIKLLGKLKNYEKDR